MKIALSVTNIVLVIAIAVSFVAASNNDYENEVMVDVVNVAR